MTQEQIQTYTLRVSQASPCELVVIMYDIILDDVRNAVIAKRPANNVKKIFKVSILVNVLVKII